MGNRRSVPGSGGSQGPRDVEGVGNASPERWRFDNFTLDLASRTLSDASGNEVPLWRSEFSLLVAFLRAHGRVLSREQLLDAVSGRRAEPFDRSIDVLVGRLRRKIELDAKAPRLIRTVPGVGYKFAVLPRVAPASAPYAESEGQALAQVRAVHQAERRQLTVLRCAIDSAGALAGTLDPEDWGDIVVAFRACCTNVVEKFGGAVAQSTDDQLLSWFGYPEANEFDAERAIRAGLALVEAVSGLTLGVTAPLQTRIGIASGLVVVGAVDATAPPLPTALGEPSKLAAALLSHAAAGAVVIAASTRRLVRGLFEQRALAPFKAEGFTHPIEAWRVTDAKATASRFLALRPPTLSPLVGRDEELELLLRRWGDAKAGRGRIVFIAGEPGIGKSRLLHAFEQHLSGDATIVLRYFCSPHHADRAFFPVIEQLEQAAGLLRADSADEKLAKLEAVLATSDANDEHIGMIVNLLAIPVGGRFASPVVSPQQRKGKTLSALLAHLCGLSARQPVLVLYEDVHWIDPSSMELLSLIAAHIAHLPVLLLITGRPEFRPPWPEEAHLSTMTLRRLDRTESASLIARVAAGQDLPDEVVGQIATHGDGVPLFVEELTKAVLEIGPSPDASGVDKQAHIDVPASVLSSLLARLDHLGPARAVARIGAVIGREFDYDLLRAVADMPEADLASALDRLCASGLILRRGYPPEAKFLFKHALVQDAAYGSLLRADRRSVHRKIAEALEAQFCKIAETRPNLLAHHFTEAAMSESAVRYLLRAGQQALGLSAMAEAATILGRALGLIITLPDGTKRQENELDLQIALGQATIATQGYAAPAVGRAYARARELCEQLRCMHKMLPILYGQWAYHSVADLIKARDLAAEIEHFSQAHEDAVARVMSCRASGLTHLMLGDFGVARTYLEQGLMLYDTTEQGSYALIYATTDPIIFFHSYLSLALACCGDLDSARAHSDSALAYARSLSHAHSRGFALHWTWVTRRCAGAEPQALLAQADELVTLSSQHSFAMWRALALGFRGWCLAALGQPEEGIQPLKTALSEVRASGMLFVPLVLMLLADVHRIAGAPQFGLACVAEAEQFAETTLTKWLLSETIRLRGALLLMVDDSAAAEASFLEAIALAQRQGARLFELDACSSLARLWHDQGRDNKAGELLAPGLCDVRIQKGQRRFTP
jgi:class 3 adenylate cyclase/tetratricopeptide (TPR) repeat protein